MNILSGESNKNSPNYDSTDKQFNCSQQSSYCAFKLNRYILQRCRADCQQSCNMQCNPYSLKMQCENTCVEYCMQSCNLQKRFETP
ncbi:Ovarian abundant message protein [Dirofilaria immitis]